MRVERLKNGLILSHRPLPGRNGFKICVASRMSARHERISQFGITHFCEHGLLGGTGKMPPAVVKKEIEILGGSLNAYTSQDMVSIEGDFASQDFKRAAKLVGDLFFFPSFPKAFMEQERSVIVQEIAEYTDDPWGSVSQDAMELFYKGRGVGVGVLGWREGVARFGLKEIKDHWKKVSATGNCVIYIVGNVGFQEMDFVRSRYGDLRYGKGVYTKKTKCYPGMRGVDSREKDQVYLSMVFEAAPVEDHQEAIKAQVLSSILGDGMNSRIWKRVREEMGAAYEACTQIFSYRKNGHLEFLAALDPGKWEMAMEAMLGELKKLADKGPCKHEIRDAVKGRLRYNVIAQDDPCAISEIDVENICSGCFEDPFSRSARIMEQVSEKDIKLYANKVLESGEPTIQVLGPVDTDYFQ
jgi:predicted Zn-dependent peptidase